MPIPADILTQLADALAEIYPDHASVRMMATTAGVPVERIPVDNKPLGYWVNLLQEAENRGLTQTLLDRAAAQYSVEPRLAAARQAYTAWALPPLPPRDLPEKPFRYLDWYRREDAEVFFGRGREIRELLDHVTAADSPPIILLYGQSGVGKSSLLAAGLVPRLESTHAVRYARRDQDKGLLGTLVGALGAAPGDDLRAVWRRLEGESGQPLVLILDQVEEVYTRAHPQQPTELADFLDALEGLFADAGRRPPGRLLLGFRKEWLAEIQKRMAERGLPRGEVFVERLGRAGIPAVVAGPQSSERLRAQFRLEVATALPGLIADDLLADRESPVAPMLAILLTDMWDAAKKRSYDHPVFDEDLYHEFRSRGLSLDDFLGRQLAALRAPYPEVVDSGLALDILAYHTTPLATAAQHTLADLEQTYRHRKEVLPAVVEEFRRLYLLVDPSQNQPDQPPASRLAHDTLAPHVRRRFDESDKPGQRARRILEGRRNEWIEGQSGAPLEGVDLHTVEAGLPGTRELSQNEMRLLFASRETAVHKRRNQIAFRSILAALLLIVITVAARATLYPALLRIIARQSEPLVRLPDINLNVEAYEVTNERYGWCSAAGVCSEPLTQLSSFHQSGKVDYPVTGVDAWEAAIFCTWIGRRLPTFAEWQLIVTPSRLPWGDDGPTPDQANLCFDCSDTPTVIYKVGSFPSGAIGGIYDIIGNVSEWTRTELDMSMRPVGEWSGKDPQTMPSQVAIVGGSARSVPYEQLYMNRTSGLPDEDIGFRCVEP